MKLTGIVKLTAQHVLDEFDCGHESLNRFLQRHAWANQQANSAQTYVVVRAQRVVGFYSLAASMVTHEGATERIKKGQARHPIPVVLLARLAVDRSVQGQGIGQALLKDALIRSAGAASTIGARAVLVHAKDDQAKAFYEHFNFEPSASDSYHLMLLMKDIQKFTA
ncbi:MAG: GNAT family N-acetyltransferase [Steroidobacteraceae bacterium]